MAKTDSDAVKNQQKKTRKWIISVFIATVLISGLMNYISEEILSESGMLSAFAILLVIVIVGIVFDTVGVAVTSADEKPFHSMASRKVTGAQEAIRLLRNAERVSSICNDVIGDICGVVSGSASATIAAQLLNHFSFTWSRVIPLLLSALVAGLTVGGKAAGKTLAINSCTEIVHGVGKAIYMRNKLISLFRKQK